jgi:hypothetical protein
MNLYPQQGDSGSGRIAVRKSLETRIGIAPNLKPEGCTRMLRQQRSVNHSAHLILMPVFNVLPFVGDDLIHELSSISEDVKVGRGGLLDSMRAELARVV